MRDAEVEGAARDPAAVLEHIDVAEVVPQAERDRRQSYAARAHAVVAHRLVSRIRRQIVHGQPLCFRARNIANPANKIKSGSSIAPPPPPPRMVDGGGVVTTGGGSVSLRRRRNRPFSISLTRIVPDGRNG